MSDDENSAMSSRATQSTESTDGHRTAIALVSAALISIAVLALLVIFDVK
jgi:hypothetical protein